MPILKHKQLNATYIKSCSRTNYFAAGAGAGHGVGGFLRFFDALGTAGEGFLALGGLGVDLLQRFLGLLRAIAGGGGLDVDLEVFFVGGH